MTSPDPDAGVGIWTVEARSSNRNRREAELSWWPFEVLAMFARGLQIGAHLHYMLSVSRVAAVEKPRSQGGVKWRPHETSIAGLEWADERFLIEQWRERRLPVTRGVCTRH